MILKGSASAAYYSAPMDRMMGEVDFLSPADPAQGSEDHTALCGDREADDLEEVLILEEKNEYILYAY